MAAPEDPLRELADEARRLSDPERSLFEAEPAAGLSGVHRASALSVASAALGGVGAVAAVGVTALAMQLGGSGPAGTLATLWGVLALLALSVVAAVVDWRTRTWELAEEGVVLRSGLVTRRRLMVPYEHIHTVSTRSTLVERVLGLVTLDLDTGAAEAEGGATRIRGLQAGTARDLQAELFRRKALATGGARAVPDGRAAAGMDVAAGERCKGSTPAGVPTADGAPWGEEAPLATYELGPRELLLAALSASRAVAQGAALVILLVQGANLLQDSRLIDLHALGGQAAQAGATAIALGLALLLALALVAGFGVSVAAAVVSYAGFRAQRFRDRIVVERGLLSRSSHAVALERVQLVRVTQGLFRQLAGYAEVRAVVVAAPGDEDSSPTAGGVVLHPFIRADEVDRFLARMLPAYAAASSEADLVRLPPAATRRRAVRTAVLALLAAACCAAAVAFLAGSPLPGVAVRGVAIVLALAWLALVVRLALGAALHLRDSRVGHGPRHLVLVRGGARRDTLVAPRAHLQHGTASASPFQRRAGVATFRTRTAAAEDLVLRDLATADAEALLAWMRPRR